METLDRAVNDLPASPPGARQAQCSCSARSYRVFESGARLWDVVASRAWLLQAAVLRNWCSRGKRTARRDAPDKLLIPMLLLIRNTGGDLGHVVG
jgi:hypothetical protein